MKRRCIEFRQACQNPWSLIAVGFGAGLAPWAPGTFGTLAAIPLYLLFTGASPAVYSAIVVVLLGLGVVACGRCGRALGQADHPAIVWDEIVGFLITMWGIPASWPNVLLGFALFRFFDIVKPWPIRAIDRRTAGGWGVMLDDVAAGLLSSLILHVLISPSSVTGLFR
ncbi:phosphatidylglycerophosphatase A family protein [Methylococcus mesophilus]|uniref:phosphatidylglycerophosphatase A family protein n=1 Tax=Methylococcus mesophilus TaxID=2993564 RepID=UPI00224AC20F|nr:phosphatidylglycerophosphatase A [Methylococcus mesophilus]UZR29482.1 phosphatidylglycerophosphatase A [Methylococcus mesophilus]